MKKNLLFSFVLLSLIASKSFSQTVPVGTFAEDLIRTYQLLGLANGQTSFTVRPLNSDSVHVTDPALRQMIASQNLIPKTSFLGAPVIIKMLPANWYNEYNSKLPYGYNNGPLYPNVGYQTMFSVGAFLKVGVLNVQFKPELVSAANNGFPTFANIWGPYDSPVIPAFFNMSNGIDAPERFGPYSLTHVGLGQSKITVIYKNIEVGASTENIWWGPGVQNSIMMSNSAPGFLHWTFNSASPVKTPIGTFEWQLIGGTLKQSGYNPVDTGKFFIYGKQYYVPKPKVTRYISAFTFNWHPKWIDGLFLGISGYQYMDKDSKFNNSSFIKKLIPVFVGSSNSANGLPNGDDQDFAYAVNIRQVFAKENTEIYAEYARNDRPANFRDFVLEPEQASGYTLGARRLFYLTRQQKASSFLQVKFELTHLQIPSNFLLRNEPSWYVHSASPRDGYTNEGRYIGAGIGPGSNSLMIDVSYLKNFDNFGIKFERFVHNNDLYYYAYQNTGTPYYHWVDFSTSFYAKKRIKNLLISANYTPITTLNYEYREGDVSNKHASINLTYFFN